MTDNKQFDDLKKQAERLNRQLESLGGTAAKNLDDFIKGFGGGIDGASKAINNIRDQINGLDTDVNYLANSLRKVTKELSSQTTSNKDIEKSYKKLSSLANQLYNDQNQINVLSEKELVALKKKIDLEKTSLSKNLQDNINSQIALSNAIEDNERIENSLLDKLEKKGKLTKKEEKLYKDITDELTKQRQLLDKTFETNEEAERFLEAEKKGFDSLAKAAQTRLAEEQKINRTLGTSGKIVDGIVGSLGKLGISSDFFEDLKEDMRDVAKSGDKWKVITAATKGLMSGIGDALKDPVTQLVLSKKAFEFFLNAAIKSNKESVNLSKNLGYGAANADRVRANFVSIESSSNNINVTTANLSEAFNELSSATGFVTEYSADALETQIKLTKQLGLSGDEAAGIYELSVLNGKSSEATYQSMLKGYVNTRNSLKVGVPFKAAIAEAAKVSGQLAANMGYNAEKIISGVVATKALGTSLEQAKTQGESLLDFQSSIENELQAELITGKQLNLEKARAAALMGDQVAVAEELAAQGMTAAEFSNMNVIAQNAYAKALGTTSNELADQLKKREVALASGKSLAEITAEEAEEATKRQDIQTKFNAGMEKLQSLIGNLLAGPLGSFLEMLAGGLDLINKMITPLTIIGGLFVGFNIAKAISLGIDRAAFALKAQSMGQEFFINRAKKVGLILDKESLISRIAYNAYSLISLIREQGLAGIKTYIKTLDKESLVSKIAYNVHSLISLIREQGLAGIKTYILGLEEKNLARKIIMGVYDTAAVIAAKTKALFEGLSLKSIIAYIAKLPILLGLRGTEAAIATTTAAATVATASAGTLGIGTVAIIAGIAAIMGALATYAVMKDGEIDLKKGPIMQGDFGTVQINPEDEIFKKKDDNMMVGTDLFGSVTSSITPSINGPIKSASYTNYENNKQAPPLDLTPMISVMNDVKSAIGHLNNKKWDVYLDSSRVGRGMVKGQTQSA
jgi:hypothetical protein